MSQLSLIGTHRRQGRRRNAVCAQLQAHGVKLLSAPVDRPWSRRTAAFADPAGSIWEIAQILP